MDAEAGPVKLKKRGRKDKRCPKKAIARKRSIFKTSEGIQEEREGAGR